MHILQWGNEARVNQEMVYVFPCQMNLVECKVTYSQEVLCTTAQLNVRYALLFQSIKVFLKATLLNSN